MTNQPRDLAADVEAIARDHEFADFSTVPKNALGIVKSLHRRESDLLQHIAALSRELEEMRKPAIAPASPEVERLRAENERLTREAGGSLPNGHSTWHDAYMYERTFGHAAQSELTALRRPVEQNAEIKEIRRDQWPVLIAHLAMAGPELLGKLLKDQSNRKAWQIHTLLSFLDITTRQLREQVEMLETAQGEVQTLKRCLLQAQNAAIELAYSHTCFICGGDGQVEGKQCDACSGIGEYLRDGESFIECIKRNRADAELALKLYADEKLKTEGLSGEITRLSSPPQERAEIVGRQPALRYVLMSGNWSDACYLIQQAIADIDTLIGDCAAWRNAHSILLAERDQLKSAKLQHDTQQRAAALALHDERIERLEGALRNINAGPHHSLANDEVAGWAGTIASAALAASQQHTAGSGYRQTALPVPSVADKDGYRYCEFCGCHTNAKQRFCCDRGMQADKQRHATDPRPVGGIGIDQGQFLAACGGGNAAFGERNSGGTPE